MTKSDNPLVSKSIKDESHVGSIFFPLPDGSAIIYDLIGKSLPPVPL